MSKFVLARLGFSECVVGDSVPDAAFSNAHRQACSYVSDGIEQVLAYWVIVDIFF